MKESKRKHVEFLHRHHFEHYYHRTRADTELSDFIDFFWETKFDDLFKQFPDGFSDVLFPNIGYTYLINLGTPFVMQLGPTSFELKTDSFLPRNKRMICHHYAGNKIFGIKFKVSPIILQKKVNFYEYNEYIFPLAYLIDPAVIKWVKEANTFSQRVDILSTHYRAIIQSHAYSFKHAQIVTKTLSRFSYGNEFDKTVNQIAKEWNVSSRTLLRYFQKATSTTCKQALQIMRIRKAFEHFLNDPDSFHYRLYGYYDYSHFYKHLRQFITLEHLSFFKKHLQLLKRKEYIEIKPPTKIHP